jgi:H+/Cl- antiporter ClcA
MQSAFTDATTEQRKRGDRNILESEGMFSSTSTITPVVLSAVLSALCARSILGEHLTFQVAQYSLPTPLIELPMYLLLGAVSGCVAFSFSQAAKLSKATFDGKVGNEHFREFMQNMSPSMKPVFGGLFCGLVGLAVPQILFFGYETLNPLLSKTSMPTTVLLTILFAKAIATAVSIGSGLVGGTFAPALFLGGMTGAAFHNLMVFFYDEASVVLTDLGVNQGSMLVLADLPAYAMVGSASVLAALFRAPLTASLLLFELSRDYDVILPLIASAGVGSVVADILEDKFEREKERRRDQDSASWGDLSSDSREDRK